MKILVCGSRSWEDEALIAEVLKRYTDRAVTVIHGGARGVDEMAGEVANRYGYDVEVFYPQWSKYGRSAGFKRNTEMLDQQPDLVLAFHHNRSRGTQDTIDQAQLRGLPVEVFSAP